ncbi:MAG: molybdopterin biosynthesis protein [Thermoanaerobacteraceae bacterium]|nr:molybdopterin biosynthesis protein [Thermoanaerobacteraceae bacterium]
MERKVYLENKPYREALREYLDALKNLKGSLVMEAEKVPVHKALGRVTAEPVTARNSVPHYHAAAMDGIAVKAEDTYQARETSPVVLTLGDNAVEVDTGDPLPPWCNAVIMIEEVQFLDDRKVEIAAAASPWQHVRAIGEDMLKGQVIVPVNHTLTPADLGAVLAGGNLEVRVRRKPRVAVMPTGTELVLPGNDLKPGDIVEFNGTVISSFIYQWGGEPEIQPVTEDDERLLRERLVAAVEKYDIVVINAGSSAGREDYTAKVIGELGQVLAHGVAIKPGKPVILGIINKTPVIGLPGYPVSAALTAKLFLRPLIYAMLSQREPEAKEVEAVLSRSVHSPLGMEEFVRVRLGQVEGKLVATPLGRGAGVITSLVKADGMLVLDRLSEGRLAGEKVKVQLMRDPGDIRRTLMVTGSHDMSLDLLDNLLRTRYPGYSVASSHVGSLSGLVALANRECHCAGTHLLDPETGEYNVSYVRQYLGDRAVLVNLVYREQGLIVPRGNPKQVRSLEDLTGEDIVFINRQRGSGTRVLLDYELRQKNINPRNIRGYRREEYSHLAAAAAVKNGTADVTLGIKAAAQALGLEFIPVAKERYDLCIPGDYLDKPLVKKLLSVIRSEEFRRQVEALGGYDASQSGTIIWRPGEEE